MFLVTGASGNLGQRVLNHLLNTLSVPANQVVAASRNPDKLAAWAAKGVMTRALDFEDATTFGGAFAGVTRALLISTDALDKPGRRLAQHQAAIAALAQASVQHVVYTSMPKPEASPLLIAPDHEGTEKALATSALPGWTVLRNHWYLENLFLFLPSILASGTWYSADEGLGSADIARDDLALAAATSLANQETGKHTYTLSGPKALTRAYIVERLNAALGKNIQIVPVSVEAWVLGAVAGGLPEPIARVYASFDTNTAAGRVAEVTNDFTRITGREAQSFDSWLVANQAALAAL